MLMTVVSIHWYCASFFVPSASDCFSAATWSGFPAAGGAGGCWAARTSGRPSRAAITAARDIIVTFMVVSSIGGTPRSGT